MKRGLRIGEKRANNLARGFICVRGRETIARASLALVSFFFSTLSLVVVVLS